MMQGSQVGGHPGGGTPIRTGIDPSWRGHRSSGSGSGGTPIGPAPQADWPRTRLVIAGA